MASNFQLTRFGNIFSSKEEAINSMKGISRLYSELVAAKYESLLPSGEKIEEILVVIFKSNKEGDFDILYDSGDSIYSRPRVFTVRKSDPDQTDEECISIALFGEEPILQDIVVITSYDKSTLSTYMYYNSKWILIGYTGNDSGNSGISIKDSDTVELKFEDNNTLVANVKIDNESIVFDSDLGKIRVNKIYGGTF